MAMATQNEELAGVLDLCLDQVLREGGSVEACLRQYPDHAAELEPLLRLALETRRKLDYAPGGAAKAMARMAIHRAIRQRETRQGWRRLWRLLEAFSGRLAGPYRWAVGTAVALLLVVLGGTGVVAASSNSLPDQPLYPVKRVVERMRLTLTFDKQAKAQVYATLANRRVEEIAIMGAKGDKKRVQDLMADLSRHLRQIQRSAFPEVSLPDLELAVVAEPDGTPQSIIPRVVPAKPVPFDKRNAPTLRQLNAILEKGLQKQDEVLIQALRDAPTPAKEELKNAHQAAQRKYQALIQAIYSMTEEESAPGEAQR